jgi:hypothetical protein
MTDQFIVQSHSNRDFTMTEELDIYCARYDKLKMEFFGNMAWFEHVDRPNEDGVQIFAIGDNLYLCHQVTSCNVYVTNSLKDAMDQAAETIYTA